MRHLVPALLLALAACGTCAVSQAAPPSYDATVIRVVDGDTVWLKPLHGGKPAKARASGIDAPESCQSWGRQSTQALRERVLNQRVHVTVHGHDDNGRLLVSLQHGDTDVWGEQVERGLAWNNRFAGRAGPYATQEHAAREHKRGLWVAHTPLRPVEFRRSHGACALPGVTRHKGSPHAPPAYQAANTAPTLAA